MHTLWTMSSSSFVGSGDWASVSIFYCGSNGLDTHSHGNCSEVAMRVGSTVCDECVVWRPGVFTSDVFARPGHRRDPQRKAQRQRRTVCPPAHVPARAEKRRGEQDGAGCHVVELIGCGR